MRYLIPLVLVAAVIALAIVVAPRVGGRLDHGGPAIPRGRGGRPLLDRLLRLVRRRP